MTALELRLVSKLHGEGPTGVQALRDVDLSVEAGELLTAGRRLSCSAPRGERLHVLQDARAH